MKLAAIMLLTIVASSTYANVISGTTRSAGAATGMGIIGVSSGAPLMSSSSVYACQTGLDPESGHQLEKNDRLKACASSMISTSSTGALLLLKEEAVQVEPDVYDYLAGEEMTLALETLLEKAKNEVPEFAEASDLEIIAALFSIQ